MKDKSRERELWPPGNTETALPRSSTCPVRSPHCSGQPGESPHPPVLYPRAHYWEEERSVLYWLACHLFQKDRWLLPGKPSPGGRQTEDPIKERGKWICVQNPTPASWLPTRVREGWNCGNAGGKKRTIVIHPIV